MDYVIIGLGNPGLRYRMTRHNVAWIILEHLLDDVWKEDKYLKARYQHQMIGATSVHYLLPLTFMNRSGEAVTGLKKSFPDIRTDHIIVIHDDVDLPLGKIKISFDRGSGGHNGVTSIINHLGSKMFIRIRIGVSYSTEHAELLKPAVLGNFHDDEREFLQTKVSKQIHDIITCIIKEGYQVAMNRYHTS